jgi:hypothetical protein
MVLCSPFLPFYHSLLTTVLFQRTIHYLPLMIPSRRLVIIVYSVIQSTSVWRPHPCYPPILPRKVLLHILITDQEAFDTGCLWLLYLDCYGNIVGGVRIDGEKVGIMHWEQSMES